jgi:protoporphyrinogen oxidase
LPRPIGDETGIALLGAGPAGLTAAHVLASRGERGAVFEADGAVGGIAKTVEFDGYRFDLGGHRFYTKLGPVQRLWEETLGDDFLVRSRMSRIFYRGRLFNYPLRAQDVFRGLGVVESARCALSYVHWRRRLRHHKPASFEEWVTLHFGRRLYDAFFRSYTEKVWGIPGSEIKAEWAAQRIQDFSLSAAVLGILGIRRGHTPTQIEEFHYPRLGPGQMWEELTRSVSERGVPVHLNQRCVAVRHAAGRAHAITLRSDSEEREIAVDGVVSSIPLSDLILSLDPPAPEDVRGAARRLRYRSMCLVAVMTDQEEPFPDNWIYIHDPRVSAGRVQNFGAWSPDLVRPGTTCLGVEYFCFEDDEIWGMDDERAVELAIGDLSKLGLVDPARVTNGVKVRVPRAYPMYDGAYREAVAVIRGYLDHFENLVTCGRNGLHRYNNQDHSMWTAALATRNLLEGASHDVWSVNTSGEYLEEGELSEELAGLRSLD